MENVQIILNTESTLCLLYVSMLLFTEVFTLVLNGTEVGTFDNTTIIINFSSPEELLSSALSSPSVSSSASSSVPSDSSEESGDAEAEGSSKSEAYAPLYFSKSSTMLISPVKQRNHKWQYDLRKLQYKS